MPNLTHDQSGVPRYKVSLTERQMGLIIGLINDEPTSDEDEIEGIKRKILKDRSRMRRAIRQGSNDDDG